MNAVSVFITAFELLLVASMVNFPVQSCVPPPSLPSPPKIKFY